MTSPLLVRAGTAPLPRRIATAALEAIADGRLGPGDPLPASRTLASELGVSRGVVVAAYDELIASGVVEARTGAGTFVASGVTRAAQATIRQHLPVASAVEPRALPDAGDLDLRPGHADTSLLPPTAWRRAWRAAASQAPGAEALSDIEHPDLQQHLSDHLRRVRGVVVTPHDLVIVPGASAAIALAVESLGSGATVAVEDPGYRRARWAIEGRGARWRAVTVDEDGLDRERLRVSDAGVYVTPAHQYPWGGRMPLPRRMALIEWARQHEALVIEDDYDGEFRYGVPPLPALRSLDGADTCVAYVGTASKVLSPDLGLAWLAPPPHLVADIRDAQRRLALGANPVAARALTHLLSTGEVTRQLARASRLYRARRDALVAALEVHVRQASVVGVEAGLHLVALIDGIDDVAVTVQLRERGVWAEPLSGMFDRSSREGLVLGYARLPESLADRAAAAIAASLRACGGQ